MISSLALWLSSTVYVYLYCPLCSMSWDFIKWLICAFICHLSFHVKNWTCDTMCCSVSYRSRQRVDCSLPNTTWSQHRAHTLVVFHSCLCYFFQNSALNSHGVGLWGSCRYHMACIKLLIYSGWVPLELFEGSWLLIFMSLVILSLCSGFVRGSPASFPSIMSFQNHWRDGALLTIVS